MGENTTAAEFPRRYRIRTGWRFAMLGFGLIFLGLAGVGWYFGAAEFSHDPYAAIVLMCLDGTIAMLGICSLAHVFCGRPILILTIDSVESRGFFSRRCLYRQAVAGYRIHNQGYSLYEVILEPVKPGDKPVKFSSLLARDEILDDWLNSLTDLDYVDEQAATEEIAADLALGDTPEDRLERLETARLIAVALNFMGFAVTGWVLLYPMPYDLVMIAAAILPWCAVAIFAIWPHLFRLDGKKKDQHAQLFGLFFVPGFGLLIRVVLDIDVLDWRTPVLVGSIAGAGVAVIAVFADRGAPLRAGSLVAALLLMFPYGYGATQYGNRYFDKVPPQHFAATVQGKRVGTGKVTSYHVTLGAWGPYDGSNEIAVARDEYDSLGTRNVICVRVNQGALGMPYQDLVAYRWCPADAVVAEQQEDTGNTSIADALIKPRPVETSQVGAGVAAYQRGDYGAALMLLEDPAVEGKPEAQFMLGLLHWEGKGTPRNATTAMALFDQAAAQGHARAMNVIGYSHDHGIGVPVDAEQALTWYRRAVAKGEPRAINNLAILYRDGRGIPLDMAKAMELWRQAAKQDHAPAMNNLGVVYATGNSVPKDMEQAAGWWRRAARVGDRNGAWMLARHLLSGPDTETSLKEAVFLASQAGKAGVAEAAYVMSLLHREGRGVPQVHQDRMNWLDQAARLGHPVAAVEKGITLNAETFPTGDRKHSEAVRMFRLAADRGYARAQALLGQHYASGLGIARSQAKAIVLYRKAADQGDALGQRQLGYAYDVGQGVERDHTEAARYYRLAAAQGDVYAAYNISLMLHQGKRVPQDVFEAFKWSRIAAEKGHATAINNVAFSYAQGIGVKRDVATALKYYRRAAAFGQPNALHSLAALNYVGQGVKRDLVKAYYWLLLAERFYPTPRDRARLDPLKEKIVRLLSAGNVDSTVIEREAEGFTPSIAPEFPLPPARQYQTPRRG